MELPCKCDQHHYCNIIKHLFYDVLKKHNFKLIAVFWDVMSNILVASCQCFGGTCCYHLQGVTRRNRSSETLVPRCQTKLHHFPDDTKSS